ncbi:hypothetical protein RYJ27_00535 [Microbacterium limosum]|uniref:Uncharacterized protein n=1 Tax=Microbacterium limosum TaxID=3079935 RepID=A0AAU0MH07_9MICO|nr:hypothetical protein [Microbacterium sp. Y20]WOQ69773.1 hypothetical protein RYJ27_00535 [Microbacterium sp. Y20]
MMLAAAVVLALAAPGRGRAALAQGLFPLLAIALTIAGALLLS